MSWEYWITTTIALFAVAVAWIARREARQSSLATHALQKRLEDYEYYPLVSVAIEPDGQKIRIVLTNASSRNAARDCKIKAFLRISAGEGVHSTSKGHIKFSCEMLLPQSVEYIYPEEINELVADSIPFLIRYPPEQNNFVIRAEVECSAPHPKSEKVCVGAVAFFSLEGGCLVSKPEVR